MNEPTVAYQMGQIAGAVMGIAVMFGGLVFFIVALVKAINTGKKGWIIAASITGVPVLAIVGAFVYGVYMGVHQAATRSKEIQSARQGVPSMLQTGIMTAVQGSVLPYSISIPTISAWKKSVEFAPYDYVFSYRELYIGVIAEGLGVGSSQSVCEFAQKNLSAKTTDCKFSEAREIEISSQKWLQFDAESTINNVHCKYRYYVYSDKDRTIQIVCWTGAQLFDYYAPVMSRVAESFRFTNSK